MQWLEYDLDKRPAALWAGRFGAVICLLPVETSGLSGFLPGMWAWKSHGTGLPASILWPLPIPVHRLLPPLSNRERGLLVNVPVAMNRLCIRTVHTCG
jgi:hypothetical protein